MRFAMFLLAFCVQLEVHAEMPKFHNLIEDPVNCLADEIWCSLINRTDRGQMHESDWVTLSFSEHAGVVVFPERKVRVLDKMVHIQAHENMSVETYNTQIELKKGQEIFVRMEGQRVIVRALKGDIQVSPKGAKKKVRLPMGFQNWYGEMTEKGQILTGFPRAIDLRPHLRDWSRTFPQERAEFRQATREFFSRWQNAVELGSELNRDFVERSIASYKKQRKLEALRRKKQADDDAEMRRLFRLRNRLQ